MTVVEGRSDYLRVVGAPPMDKDGEMVRAVRGEVGIVMSAGAGMRLRERLARLQSVLEREMDREAVELITVTLGQDGQVNSRAWERAVSSMRTWNPDGWGIWVREWQGRDVAHWHLLWIWGENLRRPRAVCGAEKVTSERWDTASTEAKRAHVVGGLRRRWLDLAGDGGSDRGNRECYGVSAVPCHSMPAAIAAYLSKEKGKKKSGAITTYLSKSMGCGMQRELLARADTGIQFQRKADGSRRGARCWGVVNSKAVEAASADLEVRTVADRQAVAERMRTLTELVRPRDEQEARYRREIEACKRLKIEPPTRERLVRAIHQWTGAAAPYVLTGSENALARVKVIAAAHRQKREAAGRVNLGTRLEPRDFAWAVLAARRDGRCAVDDTVNTLLVRAEPQRVQVDPETGEIWHQDVDRETGMVRGRAREGG